MLKRGEVKLGFGMESLGLEDEIKFREAVFLMKIDLINVEDLEAILVAAIFFSDSEFSSILLSA